MIKIYDGRYAVCEKGFVYSLLNNAGNPRTEPLPLKMRLSSSGYLFVKLLVKHADGKKYVCDYVHRIVAKAFIDNPYS